MCSGRVNAIFVCPGVTIKHYMHNYINKIMLKIENGVNSMNNVRYIGKSTCGSDFLADEDRFLLIRHNTTTAQTTTNTETPVATPITSQLGGLLTYSRKPGTDCNLPKVI